MPELPEVEHVRRGMLALVRCTVCDAWAAPFDRFFSASATRGTITEIDRRGKYLLVHLRDETPDASWTTATLVLHLGMSGVLSLDSPPLRLPPEPGERHTHLRLWLRRPDGTTVSVSLSDPRRFGRAVLVPAGETFPPGLVNLGPEPIGEPGLVEHLRASFSRTTRPVKAVLLDQSVIAGVGNIYADEALFAARIHPLVQSKRLPVKKISALVDALQDVIGVSLVHGGTTFRSYRRADGSRGGNAANLACYGRAGLPCLRCDSTLRSIVVAGRTTVFCPRCQRR